MAFGYLFEDWPPLRMSICGALLSAFISLACFAQTESFMVLFPGPDSSKIKEHIEVSQAKQAQIAQAHQQKSPDDPIRFVYLGEGKKDQLRLARDTIIADGELESRLRNRFGVSLTQVKAVVAASWTKDEDPDYCLEVGITRGAGWDELVTAVRQDAAGTTIRDKQGDGLKTADGVPRIILMPKAFISERSLRSALFHEMLHAMNIPGYRHGITLPYYGWFEYTLGQVDLAYDPDFRWYMAKADLYENGLEDYGFAGATVVFVILGALFIGLRLVRHYL